MAIVHEKLYQSKSLSEINLSNYLNTLIDEKLKETPGDQINFILDIPNVKFTIDKAIPIGLLINEMITNSYKHAFNSSKDNTIKIQLVIKANDEGIIKYEDNGTGLRQDYRVANPHSMGMDLIDSFVDQLDGKLDLKSTTKGLAYTINFQW